MPGSFQLDKVNVILATDCGSTTTKAILIQKVDGYYRLTHRGEAPTTVEAPFEDVTRGVINAIIFEIVKCRIFSYIFRPCLPIIVNRGSKHFYNGRYNSFSMRDIFQDFVGFSICL